MEKLIQAGIFLISHMKKTVNVKRVVEVAREMKLMKETLAAVLEKQDKVIMENEELRKKLMDIRALKRYTMKLRKL